MRIAAAAFGLVWLACVSAGDGASPAAPSNVTAAAGVSSAALSWTAPSLVTQGVLTGYQVTAQNATTGAAAAPQQTGSAGTSYTATGLAPGDVYSFTVAARTTNGTGPPSAPSNDVVPTLVASSRVERASGANPSAATSTASGHSLSARGFGDGTVTVGAYASAPEAALPGGSDYVEVGESGLSSVSFALCGATDGDVLEWWDTALAPPAWAPVAPAEQASGSSGCVDFTAASSTSPSSSEFYGTIFATGAPGGPPAPSHLDRSSLRVTARTLAVRDRVAGVPVGRLPAPGPPGCSALSRVPAPADRCSPAPASPSARARGRCCESASAGRARGCSRRHATTGSRHS